MTIAFSSGSTFGNGIQQESNSAGRQAKADREGEGSRREAPKAAGAVTVGGLKVRFLIPEAAIYRDRSVRQLSAKTGYYRNAALLIISIHLARPHPF